MKLENQVISLEQAKIIKELLYEEEFAFNKEAFYSYFANKEYDDIDLDISSLENTHYDWIFWDIYPAYTVSELLNILPISIENYYAFSINKYYLDIDTIVYSVWYYDINWFKFVHIEAKNLLEILWDLLIYLLKNNYIK